LTNARLTVEIADWEWQSLEIWGENRKIVGHEVNLGSVVELQLLLEPRHILKYWIRRPDTQRRWTIDPEYDALQGLNLGVGSEPVRKLIQPLRPGTNLVYFEGRVENTARAKSKTDPASEMFQALIDCGYPLVLEAETRENAPPPMVSSEGEEIIGICKLFGTITVSNTLFKAPLKAKVLASRTLETHPPNVLLTVEPISMDAQAEHKLLYSRLDKKF